VLYNYIAEVFIKIIVFNWLSQKCRMSIMIRFICGTVYQRHPSLQKWAREFEKMGLSDAKVEKLFRQFRRINNINVCHMDDKAYSLEILRYYKVNASVSTWLAFCMDGDVLDFRTFVYCIWNICTMSEKAMAESICGLIKKRGTHNVMATIEDYFGERTVIVDEAYSM
jgi:hypothetical protein